MISITLQKQYNNDIKSLLLQRKYNVYNRNLLDIYSVKHFLESRNIILLHNIILENIYVYKYKLENIYIYKPEKCTPRQFRYLNFSSNFVFRYMLLKWKK